MAYKIKAGKSVSFGLNSDGDNLTLSGSDDSILTLMLEVGPDQTIMKLTNEQADKLYDGLGDVLDWTADKDS